MKFKIDLKFKIENLKLPHGGQSLMEILVAVAVGTILIGGSVNLMTTALHGYRIFRRELMANSLVHQEGEIVQAVGQPNWHIIYDLTKDTNHKATASGTTWIISSGEDVGILNDVPYKKYFRVSNVDRDSSGYIASSSDVDPSTQKITALVEYDNNYISSTSLSLYLTRSDDNQVFHQTDWSGGSGQTGPVPNPGNKYDSASNIDDSTAGQITMATSSSDGILTSSILDTGVSGGAGYNSLLWQGSLGDGDVKFQIAFATSTTGTWTYYGPTSTSDYYQPNPNVSVSLPLTGDASPQNYRYIRYKVYLSVPYSTSTFPVVDDISINWSP